MKKTIIFVIAILFVCLQIDSLFAETQSFTISTSISSSVGVSIEVVKKSAGSVVTLPPEQHLLDFNPMILNTANNIWMPSWDFLIIVRPDQGNINATVSYTDEQNPNGPSGKGLGQHSYAWFQKLSGGRAPVDLPAHGPRKPLADITNEHISASELAGWAPLYIHLYLATGDPSEPAGVVPFTTADATGTYTGTITITATLS